MTTLNVGHRIVDAVATSILYPTDAPASAAVFDGFPMEVAEGGDVVGEGLGLVVFSHGAVSSPWLFRDLAADLARAGHVVVMTKHPGDHAGDDAIAHTVESLERRPRHVKLLADAAFDAVPAIDRARGYAVVGHSVGGYTALVLAGGRPVAGPNDSSNPTRPLDVVHDARVRALVLFAPAVGWLMEPGALADVRCPIFLRTGSADFFTPSSHADALLGGVPDVSRVDHAVVEGAGHFSFMSPCEPPALAAMDPPGFDRRAYAPRLVAEVRSFLGSSNRSQP